MSSTAIETTQPSLPGSGSGNASTRRRKRGPRGGALILLSLALILLVVLADWISAYDPTEIVGPARMPPGLDHLFGTDHLGRDVLARTLFGGQQTLLMAAASTALAALIGVPIGVLAGYFGKWQATISMRSMDVLLAFPGLLLALVVITIGGAGLATTILAVGISFVPVFARVIYGTTQRVRNEEYVLAAQVIGSSPLRIVVSHVMPVVLTEVVVLVSSAIGWTTLLAAALNFLGFGVTPPTAEWGADLGVGAKYLAQAWWISAAPGLAITATILLANFVGDAVAQRLDAQPAAVAPVPSVGSAT